MQSQTGHNHPEDREPELGAFQTHGDHAPNIGAHHENTGVERRAERHMPGAFDTGNAHHHHHHSHGGVKTGDVIADSLRNEGKDTQREYRHEAGLAGATHAGSTVDPNTMDATGNKHEQHQGVGQTTGVGTGTAGTVGADGRLVHPPGEHTRDDHGREHHSHHGHAGRDVAGGAAAAGVAGHHYNKHQQHKEHEHEMEVRDHHLGKHEKLPAGMAGADMHGGHHGGHHHHGPESRNLAENTALAGTGSHEYNRHKEHKAEHQAERAAQQGGVNRPDTLEHDGRHGAGAGAGAGGRSSLDGDATERSPNDGSVPAQAVREDGMTAEDRKMRASMKAMGISRQDWVADKFTPAPTSPTSPADGRRDSIPGRRISRDMGTSPTGGTGTSPTATTGDHHHVPGTGQTVPGSGTHVPGTGQHVGGTGVGGAGVGNTGAGGANVGTGVGTGGATGGGLTGHHVAGTGAGVNDPSMLNRSTMAGGDSTTLNSGTAQQPTR